MTEAGRDAFDKFCRLRQGELQLLAGGVLQAPQPVLVKECELVKDVLNVLIGVVSATFSLCQVRAAHSRPQQHGTGPLSTRHCPALYRAEQAPVQGVGSGREGHLRGPPVMIASVIPFWF